MKRFFLIALCLVALSVRGAETLQQIPLRSSAFARELLTNTTGPGMLSKLGVSPTQIYNGSSLTNLNATQLLSGTVPAARFPTTLPPVGGSALTNLTAANLAGTLPAINGGALTNLPSAMFDVKTFGAIGNGTTDDFLAISNALYRVESLGTNGWVHIPAGTYKLTNTLWISSNTKLTLDPNAVMKRSSNVDSMLLNRSSGAVGVYGASSNIVVEGGTWDGNKANFSSTATILAFGHANNIEVRNTRIVNSPGSWHCIEFNAVKQGRITGCFFTNCSSSEVIQIDIAADASAFPWYGPYDNTECTAIEIDHNYMDTFAAGVGSHRAAAGHMHNNLVIRNNTFTNFTGLCIEGYNWNAVVIDGNFANLGYRFIDTDLDATAADPGFVRHNWKIINNTILNMTTDATQSRGIKLKWIENVTITGNTVSNIVRHGIGIDWYGRNITIANNTIYDCGQTAGTGKGIWLFGTADCVVSGNIITNCFDAAITIGASIATITTTNVTVIGNVCPKDVISIDTCSNVVVLGNLCSSFVNSGAATLIFSDVNGPGALTEYKAVNIAAQGVQRFTNLFSGTLFPIGTNYTLSTAANLSFAGVANVPTTNQAFGELTVKATGTVVITNPVAWFASDGLTNRTLTNGNIGKLTMSVTPGFSTNFHFEQHWHP